MLTSTKLWMSPSQDKKEKGKKGKEKKEKRIEIYKTHPPEWGYFLQIYLVEGQTNSKKMIV